MIINLIVLIVVIGIVCWLMSKMPIPEPINYVVYGLLAILAIWILFSITGSHGPVVSLR